MMGRTVVALGLVVALTVSLAPSWAHDGHGEDDDGVEDPAAVVLSEWEGYLSCRVSTPALALSCGSSDPNDEFLHEFTVSEDLETVVVAMVWESQLVLDTPRLQIFLEEQGTSSGHDALGAGAGASPVEFRVDAGDDFDPVEQEWGLQFRVFSTFEPQVVFQQPFTVHYHHFYGQPAPAGYSAYPID